MLYHLSDNVFFPIDKIFSRNLAEKTAWPSLKPFLKISSKLSIPEMKNESYLIPCLNSF